jgi:putative ATP-grasp target RiPP
VRRRPPAAELKEMTVDKHIRIDDIPADGVELSEDELAAVVGGLPRNDPKKSSYTEWVGGRQDTDQDM